MSRRKFLLGSLGIAALPNVTGSSQQQEMIPRLNIPRPRFQIGQEVCCLWEDEGIEYREDRGLIIGLFYQSQADDEEPGWWYSLRWSWVPNCPPIIGTYDESQWNENSLKAFNYKGLEL